MKLMKKLMIGAVAALSMASSQAAMVNVGGVIWDTEAEVDLFSSYKIRQFVAGDGSLSGFGYLTYMNDTDENTFCPGCEITFQFGGFTQASGIQPTTTGQKIDYSNGWINMYVHADAGIVKGSTSNMTLANTGLNGGQLFLALKGHNNSTTGISFSGNVSGNPFTGALTGQGFLDVVGGIARDNFNTNGRDDGSDLSFGATLNLFRPIATPSFLDASGDGNMRGNTVIPEPGSLALLGLGLLGAAVARRRKSA